MGSDLGEFENFVGSSNMSTWIDNKLSACHDVFEDCGLFLQQLSKPKNHISIFPDDVKFDIENIILDIEDDDALDLHGGGTKQLSELRDLEDGNITTEPKFILNSKMKEDLENWETTLISEKTAANLELQERLRILEAEKINFDRDFTIRQCDVLSDYNSMVELIEQRRISAATKIQSFYRMHRVRKIYAAEIHDRVSSAKQKMAEIKEIELVGIQKRYKAARTIFNFLKKLIKTGTNQQKADKLTESRATIKQFNVENEQEILRLGTKTSEPSKGLVELNHKLLKNKLIFQHVTDPKGNSGSKRKYFGGSKNPESLKNGNIRNDENSEELKTLEEPHTSNNEIIFDAEKNLQKSEQQGSLKDDKVERFEQFARLETKAEEHQSLANAEIDRSVDLTNSQTSHGVLQSPKAEIYTEDPNEFQPPTDYQSTEFVEPQEETQWVKNAGSINEDKNVIVLNVICLDGSNLEDQISKFDDLLDNMSSLREGLRDGFDEPFTPKRTAIRKHRFQPNEAVEYSNCLDVEDLFHSARINDFGDLESINVDNRPDVNSIQNVCRFHSLTNLSFTNCSISSFPDLSGCCPLIKSINLRGNSLSVCDISNLPNLTHVDVSNNKLGRLPTMNNCSTLTYLNVSSNNIDYLELPQSLTSLMFLECRHCRLISCAGLENLPFLTAVDLSNNFIRKMDKSPNKYLTSLKVGDNYLQSLPNLSLFPLLVHMDLSNNNISDINSLKSYFLPHLTFLDLSGNCITELPEISNLVSLTTLNIQNNPIGDIFAKGRCNFPLSLNNLITDLQYSYTMENHSISNDFYHKIHSFVSHVTENPQTCQTKQVLIRHFDWLFRIEPIHEESSQNDKIENVEMANIMQSPTDLPIQDDSLKGTQTEDHVKNEDICKKIQNEWTRFAQIDFDVTKEEISIEEMQNDCLKFALTADHVAKEEISFEEIQNDRPKFGCIGDQVKKEKTSGMETQDDLANIDQIDDNMEKEVSERARDVKYYEGCLSNDEIFIMKEWGFDNLRTAQLAKMRAQHLAGRKKREKSFGLSTCQIEVTPLKHSVNKKIADNNSVRSPIQISDLLFESPKQKSSSLSDKFPPINKK